MRTLKIFAVILFTALLSSGLSYFIFDHFDDSTVIVERSAVPIHQTNMPNVSYAANTSFVNAAKVSAPAVVHIKSIKNGRAGAYSHNPLLEFFGVPQYGYERPSTGSGSGVIIKNDGLIVTNNHVIANADIIEVSLNDNRKYKAELIGTDPTTDLALLKIEANDLPIVRLGNSDLVEVGEWVLAVGNPFDLTSTVTAGIVSAKGRNISILKEQGAIESFIQTDAAVNPGNSGGALVNTRGELIGINTAIASPTGAYTGYSFSVPVNIVKKIVEDLTNYGSVQRGYLGVMIRGVDADLADQADLNVFEGVYVTDLIPEGSAAMAGVQRGDVIVGIDGQEVNTVADLQEKVGRKRPGDEMRVQINRDGSHIEIDIGLRDRFGETSRM